MVIRELQIQVFGQIALSIALLGGSLFVLQKPLPDLTSRPILHWQPGTAAEPLAESFGTLGTSYNQALVRPLFRASRRPFDPGQIMSLSQSAPLPPEQQIATAPQPLPDSSQISLKGIAISAGKKRVLFSSAEAPDGIWLALDDVISGWKVKAIDENSAHLGFGDQVVTFSLYVDNPLKPVGSP